AWLVARATTGPVASKRQSSRSPPATPPAVLTKTTSAALRPSMRGSSARQGLLCSSIASSAPAVPARRATRAAPSARSSAPSPQACGSYREMTADIVFVELRAAAGQDDLPAVHHREAVG